MPLSHPMLISFHLLRDEGEQVAQLEYSSIIQLDTKFPVPLT